MNRRLFNLHPAQVIVVAFAAVVAFGTALLMLPISKRGPGGTDFVDAFFHATSSGALISRMMNDVALLHMAVGKTLTGFGKDLLTLLALIGVMFYQDWALALASFFAFPTAILPIARIAYCIARKRSLII